MLNKYNVKIIRLALKYCCFLRVIPYYWDDKSHCLRHSSSKLSWYIVNLVFVAHLLFLGISLKYQLINSTLLDNILHISYMSSHSVPLVIQSCIVLNRLELLAFINEYLRYFTRIQGKSELCNSISHLLRIM